MMPEKKSPDLMTRVDGPAHPKPEQKPSAPSKPKKSAWYELDRLIPYRDLLMVLGLLAVDGGIWMLLSTAATVIAIGGELLLLSYAMARASRQ